MSRCVPSLVATGAAALASCDALRRGRQPTEFVAALPSRRGVGCLWSRGSRSRSVGLAVAAQSMRRSRPVSTTLSRSSSRRAGTPSRGFDGSHHLVPSASGLNEPTSFVAAEGPNACRGCRGRDGVVAVDLATMSSRTSWLLVAAIAVSRVAAIIPDCRGIGDLRRGVAYRVSRRMGLVAVVGNLRRGVSLLPARRDWQSRREVAAHVILIVADPVAAAQA